MSEHDKYTFSNDTNYLIYKKMKGDISRIKTFGGLLMIYTIVLNDKMNVFSL